MLQKEMEGHILPQRKLASREHRKNFSNKNNQKTAFKKVHSIPNRESMDFFREENIISYFFQYLENQEIS